MTDTTDQLTTETTEAPTIAPTFEAIIHNEELLKAVKNLGFSAPTPIQSCTLPVALQGKDLIIQARTGSGKTYAFVMPLVGLLLEREVSKSDVFGLIIVPTRELAVQVRDAITSLMPSLDPVCVIGGASMEAQIDHLKRDPRIVVGTPGRLLDLLRQRALKLNRCRYFVLDEADETLSSGFLEDVRAILSRLPDERQGIFASATITPRVDMLANSFLTKPEQVIVDVTEKDFPAVTHFYCDVPGDLMAKPNILCDFIETWRPRSAIIFCNTKSDTQLVELFLRRRGFDARRLNSDLTQSQRTKVMKKIRDGELRFLVATDIAARGIDIEQLDLVINYAIHEQTETYVHRTGRTGRAGRSGRALSLIGPRDFGSFHFLKKVLELEFNQVPLPSDEDLANARLSHLYEILREPHMDLGSRDVEVARKLLKEMGGVEEPSEEFEQIIAKLIRHNLEHHVQEEARSLEEELEEAQGGGAEERQPRRESRREGERRDEREHRRNERERRPERQSSEPRREEARGGRNERERGQHDKPSSREERGEARERASDERRSNERGREERRGRGDERRDERREDRGAREPRRNEREPRSREPRREEARGRDGGRRDERERGPSARESARDDRPRKPDQLRLYVGQGTAHGMTPQIFTELAKEFADINPEGIKHLVVREQYGFVDLEKPLAERLIENLNGIEYNGFDLPVEVATVIRAEQHHHRRR